MAKSIDKTKEAPKSVNTGVKQTAKKGEQLIYIGPNIPGGVLTQYAVFREGIPKHVSDWVRKNPAVERLIVPISQFSRSAANLNRPGTIEHKAVQNLLERKVE